VIVRERTPPREPKVQRAASARAVRKKAYDSAKEAHETFQSEGLPKSHRVGRSCVVHLNHVSPGVVRECGSCGRENWKWVETCIACGADV
jgi:hypothetical protein